MAARRRHPTARPLLAALVAAAGLSGCGGASAAAPRPAGNDLPTVRVDTAYLLQVQATVLVDGAGFALYNFEPDHRREVTCTGTCALSWPPLRIAAAVKARAGPEVDARLLGDDPDPSGGRVVTYNGWPLYTYADDPQPNIASGQGTDIDGGYWYLMLPNGTPLIPPGGAAPTTPATGSTGTASP